MRIAVRSNKLSIVQSKGWLCAGVLVASIGIAPRAFAASPAGEPPEPASLPKARAPAVKLTGSKNFERLVLTPPTLQFDPSAQRARSETRILGLRLPAFIALGLGGLGAGGAIATGVAANNRDNDPQSCDNRCTDHAITTRSLYITTGVLAGVAAAGVGLGIAFIIGTPREEDRASPRPTLGFNVSSEKAVAKVGWRF